MPLSLAALQSRVFSKMSAAIKAIFAAGLLLAGLGLAHAAGFFLLASSALQLAGTPVTTATVNQAYSFTVTASQGTPPYTYSQSAGSTLTGVSMNASTGVFSGTPTVVGSYSGIVLTVTDHVGATASLQPFNVAVNPTASAGPVALGGGGWLVGGDVNATDGQRLARTDTYGAYIWNSGSSKWFQLVTQSSMPAANFGYYSASGSDTKQVSQNGGGVSEIVSCPTNSADLYMEYNGWIFASTNHGTTWSKTSFTSQALTTSQQTASGNSTLTFASVPAWVTVGAQVIDQTTPSALVGTYVQATSSTTVTLTNAASAVVGSGDSIVFAVRMAPNDRGFRMNGRKMAVDPANCNHVYAGTLLNGMWETKDGGSTWTQVAGVPTADVFASTCGGATCWPGYAIAFDPSSGTTGGLTNTVYAFAYKQAGSNIYISTDAGNTWNPSPAGGPTFVQHMVVAQTGGAVWVIDSTTQSGGNAWKCSGGGTASTVCSGGSWVKKTSTNNLHDITVSASDANTVVAGGTGRIFVSTDGSTFGSQSSSVTRASGNVPWLAGVNELSMSAGDLFLNGTTLIFMEGIGVWTSSNPTSGAAITWTAATAGIEQMVSRTVIAPNGYPVVGVSDRSTLQLPSYNTAYPSNNNTTYNNFFSLMTTSGLDYSASDTTFIAAIIGDVAISPTARNYSGTSTNSGAAWKPFNSYYAEIDGTTAVNNNGSGLVRLTLPTTTGLTSWTANTTARNSIVNIVPFPAISGNANGPLQRYWPITVVGDGTHIDLIGSSFTSGFQVGSYEVYADTNPLSDNDGRYTVIGTENDGGLVKLDLVSTASTVLNNLIFCVTGAGTSANGCWLTTHGTNSTNAAGGSGTISLVGSTYANDWSGGGSAHGNIPAGGSIAVSDHNNILMVGANQDYPYCTTDGGQTWTQIKVPSGVANGGTTGWVNANFLNASVLAADRTTTGVFYAYNSNSGQGIYTITNCSASGPANNLIANSNFNSKLLSVSDGTHNDLLFSIGSVGSAGGNHPSTGATLKWTSSPSGAWTSIAHTAEPLAIGVGAIASGSDYPTVFYVGWNNQSGNWVYGVWKSTSTRAKWVANTVTWTEVSDYPDGSMDQVGVMAGDQTDATQWFVGWGGSSFAYGH